MEDFVQSKVRDDFLGGLVSGVLAIPLAMGYGMFAYTALGDSYFAHGALAGLYAAIGVGVVCVVLGDRTTTVYAPRITTTFLLGAAWVTDPIHAASRYGWPSKCGSGAPVSRAVESCVRFRS
jgi:MFS superfamily sulfate permease-like transporter